MTRGVVRSNEFVEMKTCCLITVVHRGAKDQNNERDATALRLIVDRVIVLIYSGERLGWL